MNDYQQPTTTELKLDLESGMLVTASTENMNRINDDWDD